MEDYPCERVEGWKRNTNLFKVNSHLYYQNTTYGNKVYLRCILKKKLECRGTAILQNATNLAHVNMEHNHGPEEYDIERMQLTNYMKREAELSNDSLRDIYDKVAKAHPLGSSISYHKIGNTMYKRRRLSDPPVPDSISDLAGMLRRQGIPESRHFKAHAMDGNDHSLIFYSANMAHLSHNIKHIQLDTSFRKVPNKFHQLLTIHILIRNLDGVEKVFPAFHVLMTASSQSLYSATLNKLKEILPQLRPVSALCDFDKSCRYAVSMAYPGIILQGCFFQHCRSIWQSVKDSKFETSVQSSLELCSWVKKLMCIPLLPVTNILEMFSSICSGISVSEPEMQVFENLGNYFHGSWFPEPVRDGLSLFQGETNFISESDIYHRQLGKRISGNPPKLWPLVHILSKVMEDVDEDLDFHENGIMNKKPPKFKYEIDYEHIEHCKEYLTNGSMSLAEYFRQVAKQVDSYTEQLFSESTSKRTKPASSYERIQIVVHFEDDQDDETQQEHLAPPGNEDSLYEQLLKYEVQNCS